MKDYNFEQSWFQQTKQIWNQSLEIGGGASRRKIILPEEDIELESDEELDLDKASEFGSGRSIIIDVGLLNSYMLKKCACKECGGSLKILEDKSQRHGLGSKLFFACQKCRSDNGFFTTKRTDGNSCYEINKLTCLAMRSIGKGHSAALKLFSVMGVGMPVSRKTWTKYTAEMCDKIQSVTSRNMKQAAEEVHRLTFINTGKTPTDVVSTGVSFDSSWNSRGWQTKQGVVAAIAQNTGKIIDIVHKVSYCRDCKVKQCERDDKKISSLEYMEWFIHHEPLCSLNHTGSAQVKAVIRDKNIHVPVNNTCMKKVEIILGHGEVSCHDTL